MKMTGYTKLFNSILASTIWRADDKTRIVWITLLAMAGKDGVAECSIPGLADLARVSVDDCRTAVMELQQPDPDSRTKEYEGRRITPVDGGFQILNHGKYREKLNADQRREYMRIKQAEFRARKKTSTKVANVSDKYTPLTQAEAEAYTEALKPTPPEEVIYSLYPRKVKKTDAIKAIKAALKKESAEFLALQTKKYSESPQVANRDPDKIPYPATWFRSEGYNDEADWSRQNGQTTSKAQQRQDYNLNSIATAYRNLCDKSDGGDAGGIPESDHQSADRPNLFGGVAGDGKQLGDGGVYGGIDRSPKEPKILPRGRRPLPNRGE